MIKNKKIGPSNWLTLLILKVQRMNDFETTWISWHAYSYVIEKKSSLSLEDKLYMIEYDFHTHKHIFDIWWIRCVCNW